jgi:hypothetical protein
MARGFFAKDFCEDVIGIIRWRLHSYFLQPRSPCFGASPG